VAAVSPAASDACSASFTAALAAPLPATAASLEDVLTRIAGTRDRSDVAAAAATITRELRADLVRIARLDPMTGAREE